MSLQPPQLMQNHSSGLQLCSGLQRILEEPVSPLQSQKIHTSKNSKGQASYGDKAKPIPMKMRALNTILLSSFLMRQWQSPSLQQSRYFIQKGHSPKGRSSLWHKPLSGALDHTADVAYKINHVCSKPALAGEPKGRKQMGNRAQRSS